MEKYGEESFSFTYDVFLSFRGKDVRHKFIGYLRKELKRKGINTFSDDNDDVFPIGQDISSVISEAIKKSKISIIVLSENYAESLWCLCELVKILECKKRNNKQVVFPVFYHVDPSNVRKQENSYSEAITAHKNRFGEESQEVKRWTSALSEIASLKGFHITPGRYEIHYIKKIVKAVYAEIIGTRDPMQELGKVIEKSHKEYSIRRKLLELRYRNEGDDFADKNFTKEQIHLLTKAVEQMLEEANAVMRGRALDDKNSILLPCLREMILNIRDDEKHKPANLNHEDFVPSTFGHQGSSEEQGSDPQQHRWRKMIESLGTMMLCCWGVKPDKVKNSWEALESYGSKKEELHAEILFHAYDGGEFYEDEDQEEDYFEENCDYVDYDYDSEDKELAAKQMHELMETLKKRLEEAKDVIERGKALDDDRNSTLAWLMEAKKKSNGDEAANKDEIKLATDVGEASMSDHPEEQEVMMEIFCRGMLDGLLEAHRSFPSLDIQRTMSAAYNKGNTVACSLLPAPECNKVEMKIYKEGIINGLREAKLGFPSLDIEATLKNVLKMMDESCLLTISETVALEFRDCEEELDDFADKDFDAEQMHLLREILKKMSEEVEDVIEGKALNDNSILTWVLDTIQKSDDDQDKPAADEENDG